MVVQNICRESPASQTALFSISATLVVGGAYLTALGVISFLAGAQILPSCYAILQSQTTIITGFVVGIVTMISSTTFTVIVACRIRNGNSAKDDEIAEVEKSKSESLIYEFESSEEKKAPEKTVGFSSICSESSLASVEGQKSLHFSLSDSELGCACVFSANGRDSEERSDALRAHIRDFFANYCKLIREKSFSSDQSTGTFFQHQMETARQIFKKEDDSKKETLKLKPKLPPPVFDVSNLPSMSFVQLVEEANGKTWVLIGQAGDTLIVIETQDGTMRLTQKSTDFGLGDPDKPVSFYGSEFENIKRVVGFSWGIGGFLTLVEVAEVLEDTTDSSQLLNAFQNKILKKANFPDKMIRSRIYGKAITEKPMKFYNPVPKLPVETDLCDIALFVLDVN